jgi:hypothetical protein
MFTYSSPELLYERKLTLRIVCSGFPNGTSRVINEHAEVVVPPGFARLKGIQIGKVLYGQFCRVSPVKEGVKPSRTGVRFVLWCAELISFYFA